VIVKVINMDPHSVENVQWTHFEFYVLICKLCLLIVSANCLLIVSVNFVC
jgi:hypothetical protein